MPKSSSKQQVAEISIYTLPMLKCYHYISLFLATTTISRSMQDVTTPV